MISMLSNIENTLAQFFEKLTEVMGFGGYFVVALGVELLFVLLYGIKSAFSYEARFKRAIHKANNWLFVNKKLTPENIRKFTNLLKKAPKRVTHFWQQFIMYREGGPIAYMTEDNLIEKPLRTSSWLNNVKNLGIFTVMWAFVSLLFGFASQANGSQLVNFMLAILPPLSVAIVGGIAMIMIKGFRVYNLDDMYEAYHIFSRFLTNACDDLPPYIEIEMLFSKRELSKASVQLKEFYEANARKAKAAFEEAKRNEEKESEFDFSEVGVDGALLLDRAMRESENYINQKTKIQSQIAQVEAQKDAMRRNYENIQMDLQRKIQASKENIQKLIEQQAATTSRIEVGLLRQQQDKEAKKLEDLQRDYDKEETRFKGDRDEHEREILSLKEVMRESLAVAEKGMTNEYNTFLEKLMRSAYAVAEKKVERQQRALEKQSDKNESELISVQTQIKRLMDENMTLRAKLEEYNPKYKSEQPATPQGYYDDNGNFVYSDGSYHDAEGLFHDVDGNVYNMNGEIVSKDYTEEEAQIKAEQDLVDNQINQFGAYIDEEGNKVSPNEMPVQSVDQFEETQPVEEKKTPIVEDFVWDENEAQPQQQVAETQPMPVEEEFDWEEPETSPAETNVAPAKDELVWNFEIDETPEGQTKPVATKQPISTPAQAPAKRGRPRKEVKTEVVKQPSRGRGRPRKEESPVKVEEPAKKRGRPRKEEAQTKVEVKTERATARPKPRKRVGKEEEKIVATPARGRGRPRKEAAPQPEVKAEAKKRGRPRKEESIPQDVDSVERISQMISDEEARLSKMRAMIDNEINQSVVEENNIDQERARLVAEFETLKLQAEMAKIDGTSEEVASINARLQDLIKQINVLNNKR